MQGGEIFKVVCLSRNYRHYRGVKVSTYLSRHKTKRDLQKHSRPCIVSLIAHRHRTPIYFEHKNTSRIPPNEYQHRDTSPSWAESSNTPPKPVPIDLLILQQQILLLEVTLARLSLDILRFEWTLCLEINAVGGHSG
jgi:hypothetical protein